ncbi:MAG: glucose-6-phosphate isomerase, partial [Fusobacteria bacterium]|nr:glucose-6-phosphate isomerase [Fusobacteriota bacterium]
MKKVSLNWSNAKWFVSQEEMNNIATQVTLAHTTIHEKTGAGSDFLGWLDLPVNYCKEEFSRIQKAAAKIQSDSDILLVVGIGGSYLGARAAVEYIKSSFHNQFASANKLPEIIFLGTNMSARYIQNVINSLEGKDFSINVISKSGTTTEPAIAFRIFRELIEKKYGNAEAVKRIYATTDAKKGALRTLADQEGYETFIVPDDIGGRFSVLTAVGLLPIAAAGANIQELMDGAAAA